MARGFNTTFGAAITDRIVTPITTLPPQVTYAFWMYRDTTSGTHRIFDKRGASTGVDDLCLYLNTANNIKYEYNWTGGQRQFGAPVNHDNNVWLHVAITFDASTNTNLPTFWLNGVSGTMTSGDPVRTGTPSVSTNPLIIANRSAADRALPGMLAEFGRWDRILADDEIIAQARGYTPDHMPHGQTLYLPMVREVHDERGGALAVTGTAYQNHPTPIIPVPARRRMPLGAGAPPEVTVQNAWLGVWAT